MRSVPLLDLAAQHAPLRAELEAALTGVMASGRFVGGAEVERFERDFAAFCGARHCVGVGSGTDALRLGLWAAGVGPGDEVVTTAMTFIATVEAILEVGALPVLADPDPLTGLLTVEAAEAAITDRTVALLPVHLYGQAVDLAGFRALADRRGLLLVEDACQAHGAERDGLRAGSVGDFAAFSFYPGKNLGAFGDAGALTTNDEALATRVALLRDHGREDHYLHAVSGTNSRLDAIQAAVLNVKLPRLEAWNAKRRANAAVYDAELGLPSVAQAPGSLPVYHHYVLLTDEREELIARLGERGVATGVHYPVPLHRQPGLTGRVVAASELEAADSLADTVLSIPVHPELSPEARELVIDSLGKETAAP